MHKIHRKWEEDVRSVKTSTAKTASWQGVKSKATNGISWAMSQTTSANLEFLNRIVDDRKSGGQHTDFQAEDSVSEGKTTYKTGVIRNSADLPSYSWY